MSDSLQRSRISRWVLVGYCVYLVLPLYWLLTMALRSNSDILGAFEWFPATRTLGNFGEMFASPIWYEGICPVSPKTGVFAPSAVQTAPIAFKSPGPGTTAKTPVLSED